LRSRLSVPSVALTQELALECRCCLQRCHPDKALNDLIEARLFGAEPFSVCPICGHNVSDERQTAADKGRLRQTVKKHFSDAGHIQLMLLALILSKQLPSTGEIFREVLTNLNGLYKNLVELNAVGKR